MTRENIIHREDLNVDLHYQPDACCLIIEFVEPGFLDPWRYKVQVTPQGIQWQEGHAWLPRIGGYERQVVEKVRQYDDQLPF